MYGEMENGGAVATIDIGIGMAKITGNSNISYFEAVFHVRFTTANFSKNFTVVLLTHGQVQRHDTVATVSRLKTLDVIARSCVGAIVPSVFVTGGSLPFVSGGRMDGQRQSHNTVTTVGSREGLRVFARMIVNGAVPVILFAVLVGNAIRDDRLDI